MKSDWFARIFLVLIAILMYHQSTASPLMTAYAAGRLKVVRIQNYLGGPVHGFSCVAANSESVCYILTEEE